MYQVEFDTGIKLNVHIFFIFENIISARGYKPPVRKRRVESDRDVDEFGCSNV